MTLPTAALARALRDAVVTFLAVLATLACTLALDPEPGPAILAVVLSLSLARSGLAADAAGLREAAWALPLVSLAAHGVGALLVRWPWPGAAVFVLGVAGSIWLRRFGRAGRRAGRLVALPFVVLLIAPHLPATRVAPALAPAVPALVALVALAWVAALAAFARRVGWLPPPTVAVDADRPAAAQAAGGLRPVASTRMAAQMALALAAAFVVGRLAFGHHAGWVVLTAFIAGSGNQGRLDVVYKSALRVLGAAAGTLGALLLAPLAAGHGAGTVAAILAALFLGVWLRPLGYAWWALFVTLAFALLQGFAGAPVQDVLWPRLAAILAGALLAVGAAWFVWPVRSTDVLRRRIADALAALSDAFDPAQPRRDGAALSARLDDVARVAPAFRALRIVARNGPVPQAARCADDLLACRAPALALLAAGATPGAVRKAAGAARKSLRELPALQEALAALRQAHEAAG